MSDENDVKLPAWFAALRQQEQETAPAYGQVVARARSRERRHKPVRHRLSPLLVGAGASVLASGVLVALLLSPFSPRPQQPGSLPVVATWAMGDVTLPSDELLNPVFDASVGDFWEAWPALDAGAWPADPARGVSSPQTRLSSERSMV